MKIRTLLFLVILFSSFVFVACNKSDGLTSTVNVNDSIFLAKASMANAAEIAAGQIAADSSKTASIKQYGQMMVSEHTAAQQELQTIASQLGIGITATIEADQQAFIASLLTIKDSAMFDSTYIHRQVADHQQTINFFKQESAHGLHKDIKSYMYRTLAVITIHLQQANVLSQNY
jgi:putative membrane protein